jgi:hypothetical protein
VGDLEVLLLLVRSVGSDEMLANTLNILITVYMTIGDNTKVYTYTMYRYTYTCMYVYNI